MGLKDYEYLERKEGVCGGRVVFKGTRIEPSDIVGYGTLDEIMEAFNLTELQVIEGCHYVMMQDEMKRKNSKINMGLFWEDDFVNNLRVDWTNLGNSLKGAIGLNKRDKSE